MTIFAASYFAAAFAAAAAAPGVASYIATLTKDVNSDDFIVAQVDSAQKIVQQYRLDHALYGSPSPGTTGYYPYAGEGGQVLVGGLSDDLDWHMTTMDLASGKVVNTTKVKGMVIEVREGEGVGAKERG